MMNIEVMLRLSPGGLGYLFTKTPYKISDFFEYLAHETEEYENAREIFSHLFAALMLCMLHL